VLFPITSRIDRTNSSVRTVAGSPVLGILVGLGLTFSGLVDPVRITLQLQQKEVGMRKEIRIECTCSGRLQKRRRRDGGHLFTHDCTYSCGMPQMNVVCIGVLIMKVRLHFTYATLTHTPTVILYKLLPSD